MFNLPSIPDTLRSLSPSAWLWRCSGDHGSLCMAQKSVNRFQRVQQGFVSVMNTICWISCNQWKTINTNWISISPSHGYTNCPGKTKNRLNYFEKTKKAPEKIRPRNKISGVGVASELALLVFKENSCNKETNCSQKKVKLQVCILSGWASLRIFNCHEAFGHCSNPPRVVQKNPTSKMSSKNPDHAGRTTAAAVVGGHVWSCFDWTF